MPQSDPEVDELVDQLFCAPKAPYGPFERLGPGEQRLGVVHDYVLIDPEHTTRVGLQLYQEVAEAGGVLWEHQMRALLKVGALDHPALPRIQGGRYDEDHNLAFVLTEASDFTLADQNGLAYMRARPAECVRHLRLLSDALVRLHGEGLMHRHLWPGTIEVSREGEDDHPDSLRLRLARFELSALWSNLLWADSGGTGQGGYDRIYRERTRAEDPRSRAFLPPERLPAVFGGAMHQPESVRGDVYSLGVMAWEWFLGPIPQQLIDSVAGDGPDVPKRLTDLRAELVRRLTRAEFGLDDGSNDQRKVPAKLLDLIEGMLVDNPRDRLTAYQVHNRLRQNYDTFVGLWDEQESSQPFLVAFMPSMAETTIHEWGWIDHPATTPEGRRQLKFFIEDDLKGARLVYSGRGAEGHVLGGDVQRKREARHVLLGRRGTWFCIRYRPRSPFGQFGDPYDEILLIRYVMDSSRAGGLHDQSLSASADVHRVVPVVEAIASDRSESELDRVRVGRPKWTPLLNASKSRSEKPEWVGTFERALEFLSQFQEVELQCRQYAFVRDSPTGTGQVVRLRFDERRDRARSDRYPLMGLYARVNSRPEFRDFFMYYEPDDGGDPQLEYMADEMGRPVPRSFGRARFVHSSIPGTDMIEIRPLPNQPPVPETGWLRPAQDWLDAKALSRERRAGGELVETQSLLRFLHAPLTIKGRHHRWAGVAEQLKGGGDEKVRNMLASRPFYALQGPPGTGKTTVVAHAVEAMLLREPATRLLIAAQSHAAVDNLAALILERLRAAGVDVDDRFIPLRVTTSAESEARVARGLKPYVLENLNKRRLRAMTRSVDENLATETDPAIRELLGKWRERIDPSALEISKRLEQGATLVFATCAGADTTTTEFPTGSALFDWVVVEEAAKAWPGELAIPLVRGVRWTMVGDHRQLPAHRLRDVERFLVQCAQADSPELLAHGEARAEYMSVFKVFGSLFEREPARGFDPAAEMLTTQFRMRKPIAEVVSRGFYGGALETWPTTERDAGLSSPRELAKRSLVWLDTNGGRDTGFWSNDAEAALVAEILRRLRPFPEADRNGLGPHPLAVLTPYRQQVQALRDAGVDPGLVHTVHSFQGREADIVLLSLVRDTTRGEPGHFHRNMGHLGQPEVANVALSRAKRLLVIVGRFDHFSTSGVEHWETVCRTVSELGVVVPAERLAPPGGLP